MSLSSNTLRIRLFTDPN